jgi:beta-galactosidase
MASHDIPGWFSHKYPSPVGLAIGSDGKPTGNFIPYSIHFQPYKDLLETYWRSLAPVLAAEPNVLTLNLWNEPNYGGIFSSPNVFADYSDPGIADYRAYLHKKFKDDLGAVNTALGQNYGSWDDIDPPHSVSDQGPAAWLEWTRYGQFALADFFDKERAIIKSVAPNALLANKLAAQPWDQSAASSGTNWYLDSKSEDVAGIDVYVGGPLHCRDMAEAASSESGGKPVVIYETNTMPPDAAHRTPEAVRTYLWGHVLGGADGVFVYALSRDPTYGILSDAAAGTPAREQYARFMKDVSAHQQELETHAVPTRVAIIYSTTAILLIPGITVSRSIIAADDLVQMSDVPADILSEERCTAEGLSRYSVIVLPSYTILTKPERDALDAWVAAGGKVLAFADSDTQDENLHPIDRPSWLPDTRATSSPRIQDDASRKAVVVTAHSLYSPALREVVEQALRKDIGVESPVIVGENGNADPNIMVSLRNDPDNANRRYLLLLNINTSSENVRIDLQPGWRISSEVLHGIPVTGRITVAPSEMYIFDVTRE